MDAWTEAPRNAAESVYAPFITRMSRTSVVAVEGEK